MSTETAVLGWHFLPADGRLANGDRRVVEVGKAYRVEHRIVPCENGLHACVRAINALGYAPGPIVCRVRLSGVIVPHDADKHAASERTVLAMADATRVLYEFALWCAEAALTSEREAGREPDKRSWAALNVKRRWLDGQATDDELAAAWDAAWATAWAAAEDAAWDAAWDAARDAQNDELERRLLSLLGEQP